MCKKNSWKLKAPKRKINCNQICHSSAKPPQENSGNHSHVGVIIALFRLSGFSMLSHYTAPFLDRAGISINPLLAAILIGIFRLVFSLAAFIILSFASKRTTFILAGATSTLGMLLGKSSM